MQVQMQQLRRFGTLFMLAVLCMATLLVSNPGHALADDDHGAVYAMTNTPGNNAILVFSRGEDGGLTQTGMVPTGGSGTGSGLGSQGSVVLSENQRWLFAVNAGSNEVSVFALKDGDLRLTDKVASGGVMPISLTVSKDLLYVLNAGGSGNITGFTVSRDGKLTPLAGSTQPLSNGGAGNSTGPAQISFTPNGRQLVVTEKATNQILTYAVGKEGVASAPTVHASAGTTPFGFAFSKEDTLVVTEAFGGAPNASKVSSYNLDKGNFQVISASVPTQQTAACWAVVTGNGKYAYTTNAGSSSVSGYRVSREGSLTLLNADGVTGNTGPNTHPVDASLSQNNRYLYVLTTGAPTVAIFKVKEDGSLQARGSVNVPAGTVGLTAR